MPAKVFSVPFRHIRPIEADMPTFGAQMPIRPRARLDLPAALGPIMPSSSPAAS